MRKLEHQIDTNYQKVKDLPQVIDGEDGRKDYYDVSKAMQKNALSTVLIVHKSMLCNDDGAWQLCTKMNRDINNLCPSSSTLFSIQPVAVSGKDSPTELERTQCSGVLIDKKTILTAGHCVSKATVNDLRFVFRYFYENEILASKGSAISLKKEYIYEGSKLIDVEASTMHNGFSTEPNVNDWARIELKEDVVVPEVVPVNSQNLSDGLVEKAKIYMPGYPAGLPLKIAMGAKVTCTREGETSFQASLDTFKGNSGSPVFDATKHRLIGILSGHNHTTDYQKPASGENCQEYAKISCNKPKKCECFSAHVTKISAMSRN